MLKNITRIEHKIGEKIYHFTCDQDSPIHEVKEALMQFVSFATQAGNAVSQSVKTVEEPIKQEDPKD